MMNLFNRVTDNQVEYDEKLVGDVGLNEPTLVSIARYLECEVNEIQIAGTEEHFTVNGYNAGLEEKYQELMDKFESKMSIAEQQGNVLVNKDEFKDNYNLGLDNVVTYELDSGAKYVRISEMGYLCWYSK